MYVLVCEQDAPGQMWQISGPPGLLVAGSTLSAALAAVPRALIDMAMAKSIGGGAVGENGEASYCNR